MFKFTTALLFVLIAWPRAQAQMGLNRIADSLYNARAYPPAARYYLSVALEQNFKVAAISNYYNAACC